MNETKFTPGPWECGIERMGDPDLRKIWAVSLQVASAECFWISREVQEANSRLIAAAPELYGALTEITHHMRDVVETQKNGDVNNWNGYYLPLFETLAAKYSAILAKAVGQ